MVLTPAMSRSSRAKSSDAVSGCGGRVGWKSVWRGSTSEVSRASDCGAVGNSTADLNAFYAKVVAAIRSVDADTPIMLDAGLYAAPDAFVYLKPVEDAKTLYAFHMYEPYAFTEPKNSGRYRYPGKVPFVSHMQLWDAQRVAWYLDNVAAWQRRRLAKNLMMDKQELKEEQKSYQLPPVIAGAP